MTVRVSSARASDEIVKFLISEGATCVQEDGDALVTSLPEAAIPNDLAERIRALDRTANVTTTPASDVSYDLHGTVTAHEVGELFVVPTWEAGAYPADKSIVIEPGGAFGTGDHATTRGVLHLLQRVIRSGDTVADLGAGSAVLSIAAAKLGASRVAAIEVDHDAIANAEENVDANGVSGVVTIIEGDAEAILPLLAPVDLILANIVSGALVEMLSLFRQSIPADGHAILGGILVAEREMMLKALQWKGWSIEGEHSEDDWWSVLIAPK